MTDHTGRLANYALFDFFGMVTCKTKDGKQLLTEQQAKERIGDYPDRQLRIVALVKLKKK